MDTPRADTLVRMIAVSELMGSWAYGSNNNVRVLALQQATREEFGLTEVLEWRMDPKTRAAVDLELDYNRDALREFLRTQYEMTQEVLAARGITEVISYRALSWPEGAGLPDWAGLNIGDTFEARQRPLASWSADRQIVADWLEQRGGSGVILVDRKPAQDILSIPTTGMGYFAQKEWVTLPGDSLVTLDGVFTADAPAADVEQTAASSIALGAPALPGAAETPESDEVESPAPVLQAPADRWRPLTITAQLDPADPLDNRIIQILDGKEEFPNWWPRDDSGYAITKRDLDFLGINPVQVKWMLNGEAPHGHDPGALPAVPHGHAGGAGARRYRPVSSRRPTERDRRGLLLRDPQDTAARGGPGRQPGGGAAPPGMVRRQQGPPPAPPVRLHVEPRPGAGTQ
ncbi:hypothetical protein GCM10020254_82000 [Streptomyces goshikiensis]